MKISKSKDIRIKITILAIFGVIFLSGFICALAREKLDKKFIIILVVSVILIILVLVLICILLIKFEKKYYIIDKNSIRLYEKDILIFELKTAEIFNVKYVNFFWTFAFQMGSGYLHLTYSNYGDEDSKFSTILPNGKAIHSISMSSKRAKQLANILGRSLEFK